MNTQQQHYSDNPPPYSLTDSYSPPYVDPAIPQQEITLQPAHLHEGGVCGVVYTSNSQGAIQSPGLVQTVIVPTRLTNEPTPYICRTCNELIVTRVIRKPTCKTHCCAGLLCLFMCWPCACIPYCTASWTSAEHYCPKCSAYMGSFKE